MIKLSHWHMHNADLALPIARKQENESVMQAYTYIRRGYQMSDPVEGKHVDTLLGFINEINNGVPCDFSV